MQTITTQAPLLLTYEPNYAKMFHSARNTENMFETLDSIIGKKSTPKSTAKDSDSYIIPMTKAEYDFYSALFPVELYN